jgi:hypothetical protein
MTLRKGACDPTGVASEQGAAACAPIRGCLQPDPTGCLLPARWQGPRRSDDDLQRDPPGFGRGSAEAAGVPCGRSPASGGAFFSDILGTSPRAAIAALCRGMTARRLPSQDIGTSPAPRSRTRILSGVL